MTKKEKDLLKLGNKAWYTYDDFDGFGVICGRITEIAEDHIIMKEIHGDVTYYLEFEDLNDSWFVDENKAISKSVALEDNHACVF